MLQLIKYELLKKYKSFIIFMCVFIIVALYTLAAGVSNNGFKSAFAFVNFGLFGLLLLLFLLGNNIRIFSHDLKHKTGYMLYLTPNSSYKILGAKLLAIAIENGIFILLYALIGLGVLVGFLDNTGELAMVTRSILDASNISITFTFSDFMVAVILLFTIILYWFNFMLSINLSIVMYKSFFSHYKHGFIISLVIFLVVNKVIQLIYDILIGLGGQNRWLFVQDLVNDISNGVIVSPSVGFGLWLLFIYLLVGSSLFMGTGYLMEKKMSL